MTHLMGTSALLNSPEITNIFETIAEIQISKVKIYIFKKIWTERKPKHNKNVALMIQHASYLQRQDEQLLRSYMIRKPGIYILSMFVGLTKLAHDMQSETSVGK